MTLLLATSCLQGRPLEAACNELAGLPVDGLQLCAGNAPTVDFDRWRARYAGTLRTHQGFCLEALRRPVWSAAFQLLGHWDSVHPPRRALASWLPSSLPDGLCLEVLYGDYPLGTGSAVEAAMERGLPLAVDVSHVHIQLSQGAMSPATWVRLQDYGSVPEVHVSANDGRRDAHDLLTTDAFGLPWARERGAQGTPVVVESYWHRLSPDGRCRQLDIVRG